MSSRSSLRFARGYDRWMRKPGPLAAAMRFAMSVPGQILVNTAAFTLPEELRMGPDWRVLDIGCGRAGVARVLADRAQLRWGPVGLDASRRMLTLARRDVEAEGGPGVLLVQGAATALPFAEDSFNLLLSGHAAKYLTDDELRASFVEARRVLRAGGLFLAWEFAPTKSHALDRWNRWVLTREVPLVRLRGYRELRAIAYDAGFDWVQPARLRPFLLPPIPRVSLIMGKAPEGWEPRIVEGKRVLQYAPAAG
jgi:ubiquinone/menaquinone biosynthesis C-methylase UbiE